jgi:hypothetical protein
MATRNTLVAAERSFVSVMEVIEAADDGTAQIEAGRILEASASTSAELWDRDRRVSILTRGQSKLA